MTTKSHCQIPHCHCSLFQSKESSSSYCSKCNHLNSYHYFTSQEFEGSSNENSRSPNASLNKKINEKRRDLTPSGHFYSFMGSGSQDIIQFAAVSSPYHPAPSSPSPLSTSILIPPGPTGPHIESSDIIDPNNNNHYNTNSPSPPTTPLASPKSKINLSKLFHRTPRAEKHDKVPEATHRSPSSSSKDVKITKQTTQSPPSHPHKHKIFGNSHVSLLQKKKTTVHSDANQSPTSESVVTSDMGRSHNESEMEEKKEEKRGSAGKAVSERQLRNLTKSIETERTQHQEIRKEMEYEKTLRRKALAEIETLKKEIDTIKSEMGTPPRDWNSMNNNMNNSNHSNNSQNADTKALKAELRRLNREIDELRREQRYKVDRLKSELAKHDLSPRVVVFNKSGKSGDRSKDNNKNNNSRANTRVPEPANNDLRVRSPSKLGSIVNTNSSNSSSKTRITNVSREELILELKSAQTVMDTDLFEPLPPLPKLKKEKKKSRKDKDKDRDKDKDKDRDKKRKRRKKSRKRSEEKNANNQAETGYTIEIKNNESGVKTIISSSSKSKEKMKTPRVLSLLPDNIISKIFFAYITNSLQELNANHHSSSDYNRNHCRNKAISLGLCKFLLLSKRFALLMNSNPVWRQLFDFAHLHSLHNDYYTSSNNNTNNTGHSSTGSSNHNNTTTECGQFSSTIQNLELVSSTKPVIPWKRRFFETHQDFIIRSKIISDISSEFSKTSSSNNSNYKGLNRSNNNPFSKKTFKICAQFCDYSDPPQFAIRLKPKNQNHNHSFNVDHFPSFNILLYSQAPTKLPFLIAKTTDGNHREPSFYSSFLSFSPSEGILTLGGSKSYETDDIYTLQTYDLKENIDRLYGVVVFDSNEDYEIDIYPLKLWRYKTKIKGEWKGPTAGGCITESTFEMNPFFLLTVETEEEERREKERSQVNNMCVVLAQQKAPEDKIVGQIMPYPFYIGFYIFDLELTQDLGGNVKWRNCVKVQAHVALDIGQAKRYLVVPTTFRSRQETKFVLYVYSDLPVKLKVYDP